MDDFELQVTEALTRGGDDGPSGIGLADRARRRARVRRRNRVATLAAAAVVVLAPTAVVVVHEASGASGPGDDAAAGSPGSSSTSSSGPVLLGIGTPTKVSPFGCTSHYPPRRDGFQDFFAGRVVFVSVCGYDARATLVGASDLDLVDSTSVRVAVQDAPEATGTTCPVPQGEPFVVLVSDGLKAVVNLDRRCFRLAGDPAAHTLTAELRGYAEN